MGRGSSCAGTLAKGSGLITAAALALLLPWTLLARNVSLVFFSPQRVSQSLIEHWVDDPGMKQQAGRQFAEAFLRGLSEGPGGEGLALPDLPPEALDEIAAVLLPEGWLQEQVRQNVQAFYAWIDSEDPVPRLELDLAPLRNALMAGGAQRLMRVSLEVLPPCTPEQTRALFAAIAGGGQQELPVCQPPPELQPTFLEVGTRMIRDQAANLPDSLPLGKEMMVQGPLDQLMLARDALATAKLILRWLWLIPAFLMTWLLIVNIRSWRGLGLWWGVPLALGGGQGLVLGVLGAAASADLAAQWAASAALPPMAIGPFKGLMADLMEGVFGRLVLQSGLVLAVALGLLLLALIASLARRKSAPGRQAPPTQPAAAPGEPPPVGPPSFLEETPGGDEEGSASGERPPGMFG